jgi:putative GTP pyrophosphokinase
MCSEACRESRSSAATSLRSFQTEPDTVETRPIVLREPEARRLASTPSHWRRLMSNEVLLDHYDEVLPLLRARGDALSHELSALLESDPALKVHSVAWRLKKRPSLARKIARPDRNYTDLWELTDLIGLRVITYFEDAVDRVGELVETRLPVDFRHSTDKRRRAATEFGYRSLHYVCSIGGDLPERARFEIQVRTVLEHAWAEIEHDLGYKATEEVPSGVRRRLNRLAGLLELADQEFGAIRRDLEGYARALPAQIESGGASVLLDRFSLAALLDCAEVRALDEAISLLLQKELGEEPFYPDYLLKMLTSSGIRTIAEAREGVREHQRVIAAMVQPYFTFTSQIWQLSPEQMPRIFRGYSLFFLAHVQVLRASTLRIEKIGKLAHLYRELDYPEDPRTAHQVASMLVDAFGHVGVDASAR